MQIVSIGDNLHDMSILFSGKIKKKYFNMSTAENLPRVLSVKQLFFNILQKQGSQVATTWLLISFKFRAWLLEI